jgi:hypothetical protein
MWVSIYACLEDKVEFLQVSHEKHTKEATISWHTCCASYLK